MPNFIIFGAPGSGKGTQSERIIDRYNLHHISTGELLRGHIARNTELGRIADSFISQGQLIPDNLMIDILADAIDSEPIVKERGVILDGFPRTIPQAEALKKLFADRNMPLNGVIGLEVPEEQLIDRMIKRGKDSGRSDDNPETIKKRIDVYHRQTQPLRDYYIAEKLYLPINGTGSVEEIADRISKAIS